MFKKLGSAIGTVFGFILVLAFVVLMADSNAEAPNYKSVVYAQEKAIIYSEPVKPWEPPSIGGKTLVVTYGRIGSGSWGTLGAANTPEAAVDLAIQYANQVDLWNGSKGVVAVVNPNLSDYGGNEPEESFVNKLIAVARDKNAYVMLDVQPGTKEPEAFFRRFFDLYPDENVWFDWDLEHTVGAVDAKQINAVASEYFRQRQEKNYRSPGVFAFYIYDFSHIPNAGELVRDYEGGQVIPIFDGFGKRDAKISKTNTFRQIFPESYGIMEFYSKWGYKYDNFSGEEYFRAFPDALLFARQ